MGIPAVVTPAVLLVSALAPYGLGVLLAGSSGFPLREPVWEVGLAAGAALFLAGWAAKEAFAPEAGRCPALGGLNSPSWQRLAHVCLALAGGLGLCLQGLWHTGVLTLPLGALGILGGYFTFAPPLAWHRRGWGELWGALCFGLLPVFTGYYLQSRSLVSEILFYGLPLSLAAFNLFLVMGFPPPGSADGPEGSSLAARLGAVPAALLFTVINILTLAALVFCLLFPAVRPWGHHGLWGLILLALINQELVKRRAYHQEARLQQLVYLSLALHLGMSLVFGAGLWRRW